MYTAQMHPFNFSTPYIGHRKRTALYCH